MVLDFGVNFFKRFKSIIFIWLAYLVIIHLVPFIFHWATPSNILEYSFSKYLFAIWSYSWDSSNYLLISQNGYNYYELEFFAFFPGYPILLSFLQIFINPEYTSKINSLLLLPLLIQFKYLIQKMKFEEKEINLAIIGFLSLPSAFFLNANYTETIYILLTCWGLNCLLEEKFNLSILIAFFLSFFKVTSVVYIFLIAYFLIKKKFKFNINLKNVAYLLGVIAFSSSGIISYFLYLQFEFGNFLLFFQAQELWGRNLLLSNTENNIYNNTQTLYTRYLQILALIGGSIILFKSYKKINSGLFIFSFFHFFIPIATGTILSLNRLILFCYPVVLFTLANLSKDKVNFWIILFVMIILQAISIFLFLNLVFVG